MRSRSTRVFPDVAGCSDVTGATVGPALVMSTVVIYSIDHKEVWMNPLHRQTYRPAPDRTPAWLRRLWAWL